MKAPLIGWMIMESHDDDLSNWDGVITYPDPTGANLAWENPTKMIEFNEHERARNLLKEAMVCIEDGLINEKLAKRIQGFLYPAQESK